MRGRSKPEQRDRRGPFGLGLGDDYLDEGPFDPGLAEEIFDLGLAGTEGMLVALIGDRPVPLLSSTAVKSCGSQVRSQQSPTSGHTEPVQAFDLAA